EHLRDGGADRDIRRTALRAMARTSLKEAPQPWVAALIQVLVGTDPEMLAEAVTTVRALRVSPRQTGELAAALLKIANTERAPAGVRLQALAALPSGMAEVKPALFGFLRERLSPELPVAVRSVAAAVLARARLSSEQLLILTESLKAA